MRYIVVLLLFITVSCQNNVEEKVLEPIARVNDVYLEKTDLRKEFPNNLTETDSILFTNAFINKWAQNQLLMDKAALNLTNSEKENIELLVQQYRNDMLINKYKEAVVKQELDTLISQSEILQFYEKNKDNFLLNEELVQLRYVNFDKKNLDLQKVKKIFTSKDKIAVQDLKAMEMSFNKMNLNDSMWYRISKVYDIIPNLYPELKEKLLKKSKTVQLEDSLTVSLVAVKAVKRKNDVAPLEFEQKTIRQILLHKRKLELLKQIEKDLLEDAIINKKFETYK
jgi:hypothetical protein